jgi:hypothetical protein
MFLGVGALHFNGLVEMRMFRKRRVVDGTFVASMMGD